MANIRQSILVRTDLDLPVGLLTAQVSHIHFEGIRRKLLEGTKDVELTDGEEGWLDSPYIFVHGVPNKEWLDHYRSQAEENGVPVTAWEDTIYLKASETQMKAFEGVVVGIALGPCDSDIIKAVIGDLPLL